LVEAPVYMPPPGFSNAHLQTIFPTLFRRVSLQYKRERFWTSDDDFLDLDWLKGKNSKLAILCHGLEGSSGSVYMRGMARALSANAYDIMCLNYRGCSGEPNYKLHSYHSGKTDDLAEVLSYLRNTTDYKTIFLIGFSVGGNIILKYLGEQGTLAGKIVDGAVVFSVPCDLEDCANALACKSNSIYMKRFLSLLKKKLKLKNKIYPGEFSLKGYSKVKDFYEFDSRFTARFFKYKSAEEYWRKNSSANFLEDIRVPVLMVNSKSDPFLGKYCYPNRLAEGHPYLTLETPDHGGHCGFIMNGGQYWSETRTLEFLSRLA